MNLELLYGASFVNWEGVAESWNKRTVSSRMLLFAARRYLEEASAAPDPGRREIVEAMSLPEEVKDAFAAPPDPGDPLAARWGEFVDAAVAAELETISYGERPPVLYELRTGLERAAEEAGPGTDFGRWFTGRHEALPGTDLPDNPEYFPV